MAGNLPSTTRASLRTEVRQSARVSCRVYFLAANAITPRRMPAYQRPLGGHLRPGQPQIDGWQPSKYNKGFTRDGGATVGACFMSGLFPRCECDYATRAPAYLRPLCGHPRPGQPQIDGWQPSKYNKGFTRDGGATVGACFMSGLFPRCECDYSTRAPACLRPLGGHPRPGQPQIDGWQPSKYNKGFTRDGGATVGACFMSGLFPRCECDYPTRAPAYLRPLSGHPRPGQPQIDGWQPSKYNKGFTRDGGATVGACFMSGLFPRCECDYSTRAPAYLRPLGGHPRLGQPQIDGWQPSKYNKGFTRDGGATVGACFMSGLFPRCECEYSTRAPAYLRPLGGHPRLGQPQIDGWQPSKYNKV